MLDNMLDKILLLKNKNKSILDYSITYQKDCVNINDNRFICIESETYRMLSYIYSAHSSILLPGNSTYAMEAIVREFTIGKKILVINHGYFSHRWCEIIKYTDKNSNLQVLKASILYKGKYPKVIPVEFTTIESKIKEFKPDIVFMSHVEPSNGLMISKSYIKKISCMIHRYNGLLCLDSTNSGLNIPKLSELDIDILVTVPEKGWNSIPGLGIILLNKQTNYLVKQRKKDTSSFSFDLRKWLSIANNYLNNIYIYNHLLPTECIIKLNNNLKFFLEKDINKYNRYSEVLCKKMIHLLNKSGYITVVLPENQAYNIIVVYDYNGRFISQLDAIGIKVSGHIPWKLDEGSHISTFRIGLFSYDKIENMDKTIKNFNIPSIIGKI